MNDLLVVFSLIIGSVLFFLVMTVVLIYKSFLLSKYAKGKNKKIYKKVHGIVSEGPFAVPLYNNFAYWRWVFKNERNVAIIGWHRERSCAHNQYRTVEYAG